jgi:hypothetical protein
MLLLGACDVTLDVYGLVGDNEVYTGSTSGNVYRGNMTLTDGKGKT